MDTSFTEEEKRYVLAEMIKASRMDVSTLVDFVKFHEIQPDWLQMQVPGGRNVNQCIRAASVMFNMYFAPPPIPHLKRKSYDEMSEQQPKRQAIMSPVEPPTYAAVARATGAPNFNATQAVSIQPRPSPNGYAASPATSSPTVSVSTPSSVPATGRKRGRPSKADKEAWARANPSQSTGYAPISPAPIAPYPSPAVLSPGQQQYSPGPSTSLASQVSSSGGAADSKARKKGRSATTDKQQRSESGVRHVHGVVPSDQGEVKKPAGPQEHTRWKERPRQQESPHKELEPLATPLHAQGAATHHGVPASLTPLAAGAAPGEKILSGAEHARREGHPQVANRA